MEEDALNTGRKFSLGIIFLAVTLGIYVITQSMNRVGESLPDGVGSSLIENGAGYEATRTGLRLSAITEKTEYMCGEEITVERVIFNDAPYAVNTTMPSNMGATTYSKADPDSKIRTACDISWASSEVEIPANSRKTITTLSFRCDTVGEFVIDVHGYPLIEIMVGIPHAWILGGRTGGGSGTRILVNESDLSQFPHLLEAFEANAEAKSIGYVHADHMTYCPANEVMRIIEFFGEEYDQGINWYGFKLVLEDGSMYSFGMNFDWIPPLVD